MEYKNLRVGILIKESGIGIILCLDGTFRFDKDELCKNYKTNDIILFEDSKTDDILYAIGLDSFRFYKDIAFHNENYYDYSIRKKTGICVPKEYIMNNDRIIVDRGQGYQFVIYCKINDILYVDWRYTDSERDLIRSHFATPEKEDPQTIIDDIERYLESLNTDELLESFTIKDEITYISRPGKDDSRYITKRSKTFDDGYINSLFPRIEEEISSERGYYLPPIGRLTHACPYKEEESLYIEIAKTKYSKNKHRSYLLNKRFVDLIARYKEELNSVIGSRFSFLSNIKQLLLNEMVSVEYARELNKIIRDYYRKANNAEIDWHNFYDKITR